jgi:hypothetical protein
MENVRNCGWYAKPAGGAEHSSVTFMSRCVALWLLRFQHQDLQLQLTQRAKDQFIKATDIVQIVKSPEMQEKFERIRVVKPSISERTAQRWLQKMRWRYCALRQGMYADLLINGWNTKKDSISSGMMMEI